MLKKKVFIPPAKKYYYQTNKTLSCRLSSSQCQDIDKSTKLSYVEKLIKNQMIKKNSKRVSPYFCIVWSLVGFATFHFFLFFSLFFAGIQKYWCITKLPTCISSVHYAISKSKIIVWKRRSICSLGGVLNKIPIHLLCFEKELNMQKEKRKLHLLQLFLLLDA